MRKKYKSDSNDLNISIVAHFKVFSLALFFSTLSQGAFAQECMAAKRTIKEIEPANYFLSGASERRYFEIEECFIKVGTAVLRHYAFDEIPPDSGGVYIEVKSRHVYISKPAGELAQSAVFFRIDLLFEKSAHGFLTNRYLIASTQENKSGAIMYFEDNDGIGWQVDVDYSSIINVNDPSEISQTIEDLVNLASIGDKSGKQ
jgi:hypothetical protein